MFNEEKATHLAAYLLNKHGGKMKFLKLIKLIYLTDRESISQTGFSVSTDRYVSMNKGPVCIEIYDLISDERRVPRGWNDYIETTADHSVTLTKLPDRINLSKKSIKIADDIYSEYGGWSRWQLVDKTHELPDWHHNKTGREDISKDEMMEGLGFSADEIEEVNAQESMMHALQGES